MLNLKEIKELIDDKSISDEKAKEIREACYGLADLALEVWQGSRLKDKNITKNAFSK